ncbi:TPA: hypothetical protein DCL28_01435, partial [Candidatus Komeilibacteria bacterium]|nr:hypothetical protein [Candidatus Komeilibacteria bacterium]
IITSVRHISELSAISVFFDLSSTLQEFFLRGLIPSTRDWYWEYPLEKVLDLLKKNSPRNFRRNRGQKIV